MRALQNGGIFSVAANGGEVRLAVIHAKRSERPLPALRVEMCMVQHSGHFSFPSPSRTAHTGLSIEASMLHCGPPKQPFVRRAAFQAIRCPHG